MKMTTSSRRSREAAAGSSSSSNNRYSIDMLLPGLNQTKEDRISNVSIMSEKSNGFPSAPAGNSSILASSGGGSGGKEINSMPSGSAGTGKRKDGGGEYNNGEYLSTPSPSPSGPSTTTTLSHRTNSNGTSSTSRPQQHHEDQREPPQQQQQQQRRGASKVNNNNNTGLNSKVTKKRSAASPLKPATQAKHMLLSGVAGGVGGTYGGGALGLGGSKMSKKNMLDAFQPWVLQAYGDSAKTKTITKKKYYRIVKTLRGEEINNAENSKFRFWVKAKGFHIGLPPAYHSGSKDPTGSSALPSSTSYSNEPDLFVPTTVKDASSEEKSIYKRVAVVEHFFDIIYTVHVETEAKNGKHAGQKRTYRAITEKYAFLPREAVTKFLLQCMECQKRGSPSGELFPTGTTGAAKAAQEEPISVQSSSPPPPNQPLSATNNKAGAKICKSTGKARKVNNNSSRNSRGMDINFSLPFTTTYLRQQEEDEGEIKSEVEHRDEVDYDEDDDDNEEEKGLEDYDDEDAHLSDATPMDEDHDHRSKIARNGDGKGDGEIPGVGGGGAVEWLGYHPIGLKKEAPPPPTTLPPPPPAPTTCSNNNICSNGKHDFREQSSPLSLSDRSSGGGGVNHEAGQDETSSNGNKDDEDDDDDESEDKIDTQQHDPERLKAFNMFVRLFVDENLDRMVPISKQPKEKIQAIIDSCTRQFPEFAERARKRIRTYLKSCRRNKRSRDSNGWESSRPTPAHLTSVQAEQILAQACENESQNAKRMRMGLEPVGQPLPAPLQQQAQQQQQNDRNNSTSDVVENGHHHGRSTTGSSRGSGGSGDRGNSRAVAAAIVSDDSSDKVSSRVVGSPAETERNSKSSVLPGTGAAAAVTPIGISSSSGVAATPPVTDMSTHTGSVTNQNSANSISSIGVRSVSSSSSSPSTTSTCENQYPSGGIQVAPKAHERSTAVDYSRPLNGSGIPNMSIFRPNLGQPFPRPAPFSALFPPAAASAVTAAAAAGLSSFTPHAGSALPIVNDTGPTDLSMKTNKPLLSHKLTASEITTVRQLIIGYRESAAFLLRSADELEQLLHQQQQ